MYIRMESLVISVFLRWIWGPFHMMTSSNGNIFRVTGPLCGKFTGPGVFPTEKPVTRSFDVLFDLRLNKRLSNQPRGWWFETPSWSLWRPCNANDFSTCHERADFGSCVKCHSDHVNTAWMGAEWNFHRVWVDKKIVGKIGSWVWFMMLSCSSTRTWRYLCQHKSGNLIQTTASRRKCFNILILSGICLKGFPWMTVVSIVLLKTCSI